MSFWPFRVALYLAGVAGTLAAPVQVVPFYHVGETARVDVITSVPIVVVDPEKTEALRQKEVQRVPVVYRLNTNAVADAVSKLRHAFATNRVEFESRVLVTFNRSVPPERALTNQRFRRLVASFQSSRRGFPLSSNLAVAWAKGETDEPFIDPLGATLSNAMSRAIRPDSSPPEGKVGWQIKLVRTDTTTPIVAEHAERTRAVARSNVVALAKVRSDFTKQFLPEEKVIGRFLASLLQPNCTVEVELTRASREKALAGLSSVNRYGPGDAIVRAGDVVSAGTKAALDDYRARLALLHQPSKAPEVLWWPWAAAVLVAGGCLTAILIWRRTHRAADLALVPDSLGPETVTALRNDPVIRARLLEHLTRLLGETVVQRLFAQRGQLLDAQQAAAMQAREIERRLEKVQQDVQERFTAYEQRIADLEKELAAAEEQNRDLIRAKIAAAKEELEAERARNRVNWN